MKIVVLGGAGLMGRIAVKDLAASDGVEQVIIADRDTGLANKVVALLPVGRGKVSVKEVDVTDRDGLVAVLRGADAVLNAVHYYFNLEVMQACLEAGTHYTDMGGLFFNTRKQLALHDDFAAAGLTAVLGMGSAPGVPNVHSRYAADRLDTVDSIRIYDGILPPPGDDIRFGYAIPTIIDELIMPPMVFRGGEFVEEEPLSGEEDYWFTPPVGLLRCHLSLHSEVATLPISFADKGLRECFFKINYWGMSPDAFAKVRLLADLGFASSEPVQLRGAPVYPRELLVELMADYVPPLDAFLQEAVGSYSVDQRNRHRDSRYKGWARGDLPAGHADAGWLAAYGRGSVHRGPMAGSRPRTRPWRLPAGDVRRPQGLLCRAGGARHRDPGLGDQESVTWLAGGSKWS